MLWTHRLNVVLLVQIRQDMAVLPTDSAVLLPYNAMDTWTDCSVGSAG